MNRMTKQIKNVRGQLFDLENFTRLGQGDVSISFIEPPPTSHPEYHATMMIQGCRLDLNHKACLLQFNEHTAGRVLLTLLEGLIFDVKQSTFQVDWQDSNWNNLDWFHTL